MFYSIGKIIHVINNMAGERRQKRIACIKVTESSCLEVLLNLWLIIPLCVSALISNGKEFFYVLGLPRKTQ